MNELQVDDKKYIFIGTFLILIMVGIILLWGMYVKVDTYVIAPGKVVIETFKRPIQYKEWGTVTKIFIKEGDLVKKGEPLIEVEKLAKKTNLKSTSARYYYLIAERDRLLSEKNGLDQISFSTELLSLKDETLRDKLIKLERELFLKRKSTLKKELYLIESRIKENEEKIYGLKQALKSKTALLKSYQKEIREQKELLKAGLTSKYRLLDLERKVEELKGKIETIQSQINQANQEIEYLKEEKQYKVSQYQFKVAQELKETTNRLAEIKPKLLYAKEEVKKTVTKAPVSGQVIGLQVHGKGEVIQPGKVLMFIVPRTDKIFVLVHIHPKDRDKVKIGQLVDLRFPSFIGIAANVVEGKIQYISKDTVPSSNPRLPEYYVGHVEITDKGKRQLKKYKFNLIPGMPAVAYIKAEKVTPIEYLLKPLILIVKSAFRAN